MSRHFKTNVPNHNTLKLQCYYTRNSCNRTLFDNRLTLLRCAKFFLLHKSITRCKRYSQLLVNRVVVEGPPPLHPMPSAAVCLGAALRKDAHWTERHEFETQALRNSFNSFRLEESTDQNHSSSFVFKSWCETKYECKSSLCSV